jgi:hypothetical protein
MSDAHVFPDKEAAAERYLLGQMSESDRDAYEQHFFQCVECADEVKATARFIDHCRSVVTAPTVVPGPESRSARLIRFPRAATAILTGALAATVAIMVYQNVVTIPRLSSAMEPRALTFASLAASNARGVPPAITVPRQQPFLIFVDIPPGPHDTYDCAVVAKDGQRVVTMAVAAADTHDGVPLMIPAGRLTPGDYTLVVTGRPRGAGGSPVEVAHLPFTLRFAD